MTNAGQHGKDLVDLAHDLDGQCIPDPIEHEKTEPAPAGTWERMTNIMKGVDKHAD